MATARFETIMDYLRLNVDVAVRCTGCRRTRYMRAEELEAVFGVAARVLVAQRRFKCGECGHKGAKLAPIPRLES
jgi:hypothetical protein